MSLAISECDVCGGTVVRVPGGWVHFEPGPKDHTPEVESDKPLGGPRISVNLEQQVLDALKCRAEELGITVTEALRAFAEEGFYPDQNPL